MRSLKSLLEKNKMNPDLEKDQYFLLDEKILQGMVKIADIKPEEKVLEIGAGPGNLTRLLAQKAKSVVAFEIDKRFKPMLARLPSNVEVVYQDAWKGLKRFKSSPGGKFWAFHKIVANPPYSLIEPMAHAFTVRPFRKMVLLIPKKFLNKIKSNEVFGSFYEASLAFEVSKTAFWPKPKTNSAVVVIKKLPNPVKSKNLGLFLRQYLYLHENQLVKNSLREGLIKGAKLLYEKTLTKKAARQIIKKSKIDASLLERPPDGAKIYKLVEKVKL